MKQETTTGADKNDGSTGSLRERLNSSVRRFCWSNPRYTGDRSEDSVGLPFRPLALSVCLSEKLHCFPFYKLRESPLGVPPRRAQSCPSREDLVLSPPYAKSTTSRCSTSQRAFLPSDDFTNLETTRKSNNSAINSSTRRPAIAKL
jgi:hypothetical protein